MSLIECKAGKFEGFFKDECHQFFEYRMQHIVRDGMTQFL